MSQLQLLSEVDYPNALKLYLAQTHQFPLITCVLMQIQKGQIYCDKAKTNFFILDNFGFCQMLETAPNEQFTQDFVNDFLIAKNFSQNKIHWFAVPDSWVELIRQQQDKNIILTNRIRLNKTWQVQTPELEPHHQFDVKAINTNNFTTISEELKFDLATRFWPSQQSYFQHSFGCAVYQQQQPISICYAAAVAKGIAEIDIFTQPEFQQQGAGYLGLSHFIELCKQKNFTPHWDCYENNHASANLAKKMGFVQYDVYKHAIIAR